MKSVKNLKKARKVISKSFRWGFRFLLVVFIIMLAIKSIPFLLDMLYGERFVENELGRVAGDEKDIDGIAKNIINWAHEDFESPYSYFEQPILLKIFGIFNINGTYRFFFRPAPMSWIIYSKLGNCGEQADVFNHMIRKYGVRARKVEATEDHSWSEYFHEGYRIAVDPSTGKVIDDLKEFGRNRNWSYVVAVDENGSREDVSDDYIDRGTLVVGTKSDGERIGGLKIWVESNYLTELNPKRYPDPKTVFINYTRKEGPNVFRLGEKNYTVKISYNFVLIEALDEKTMLVKAGETATDEFDVNSLLSDISKYGLTLSGWLLIVMSLFFAVFIWKMRRSAG